MDAFCDFNKFLFGYRISCFLIEQSYENHHFQRFVLDRDSVDSTFFIYYSLTYIYTFIECDCQLGWSYICCFLQRTLMLKCVESYRT